MAAALDVLSQLPALVWRDIEVPCQANSLHFAHGQVPHRQHGVDGAHVEETGREPAKFSFRIPFRAGVAQYPDLYPTRFRDFWNACLDGKVGELLHPEFGRVEAKVVSFDFKVDPGIRDGYDVDVEWIETTELISLNDSGQGPLNKAISLAGDIDTISGETNPPIEYDDGTGQSLTDSLKSLKGQVLLAQLTAQDLIAAVDNVIGAVNGMIDSAQSLTDPKAWGLVDGLKETELLLQDAKAKLSSTTQRIAIGITTAVTTVPELAATAGVALDEFLKLNPRMGASKAVASNTEYFYYVL